MQERRFVFADADVVGRQEDALAMKAERARARLAALVRGKARSLPPDWAADDDARLRATGGRYGEIAALSDLLGVTERALMGRWLRIRGR